MAQNQTKATTTSVLTKERAGEIIRPMLPPGVRILNSEVFSSDLRGSSSQSRRWYNETGLSWAGVQVIVTDGRRKDGFFVRANGSIYHNGVRDGNQQGEPVEARLSQVREEKLPWKKS